MNSDGSDVWRCRGDARANKVNAISSPNATIANTTTRVACRSSAGNVRACMARDNTSFTGQTLQAILQIRHGLC